MCDKVVVIGGAGFLGSHLADVLSEEGFQVTIMDIYPSPWIRPDQEMLVGDILDDSFLNKGISGARYVYHLAGIADIGEANKFPRKTIKYNIIGSANIVEACLKHHIERLMFASTVYVYSEQGSYYRVSKQATELLIQAYQEQQALEYTILRYGSLYGPRSQPWNGLRRYIEKAMKDKLINYAGNGKERREFIHVKDAAKLSVKALGPKYVNQCLTLTGTQSLSSGEFLQIINEIMGGDIKIRFNPDARDKVHYAITPYRFTPKMAIKMVSNEFIDIGQGILEIAEEIYHKNNREAKASSE